MADDLERGRAFLEKLRGGGLDFQVDGVERFYEVSIAGSPIGYLTRRISREEYDFSQPKARRRSVKPGLRLRERMWRFAEDGTVRVTRVDAFSSFDLQSEMIQNRQTQIPAPDVAQPPLVKTDECVREGDVLFSSFTTTLDTHLPDPRRPIQLGPVYLDWAWVRLLPGLLAGEAGPHAFATYDSDTRALITLTFRPLGKQASPGAADAAAQAFEVRAGFSPHTSRLYVDQQGVVRRVEIGDLTVTLSTKEEVERRFGARRDEAEKRLKAGGKQLP
jgi:hypothetical protein